MSDYTCVDYKPRTYNSSDTKCYMCNCIVGSRVNYLGKWYCKDCYNYIIRMEQEDL